MTFFEALTGGAFDRLNWQHSGEFDQNFSKKSNALGFARGGAWAVLELTGTLRWKDDVRWPLDELESRDASRFRGGNIKKRFQFLVSEETSKLVTFKLVNEGVISQEM